MWITEWIVCVFFAYLVVLARIFPLEGRRRLRILVVSLVCAGLAIMMARLRLSPLHPERLGVIARTSAQRFTRDGCPIDHIGRELRVRYVVEGSVRRSGDCVRISVQLIDAREQTHLWSETYEHRLDDYFAIQSEVASHVAESLAVELLPQATDQCENCCPCSGEAYQTYLEGRFHLAKWGLTGTRDAMASTRKAIEYYKQAIVLDPSFGRAHAALARARTWMVEYSDEPAHEILEAARQAADRALALDPGLSWAYLTRASVRKRLDWDWASAEADYLRAVDLSPNCEAGHRSYAQFLAAMRRHDEAVAEAERATELDPLCLIVNSMHAWVRYVSGQYDEALAACRHLLDLDPDFALARRLAGVTYLEMDRHADAVRELERAVDIEDRQPVALSWLAHGLAAAGRGDDARALLDKLTRLARHRYVSPYRIAVVHAGLGDHDRAFAALDRACEERAGGLVNVAVEPRFAPLRSDDRYAVVLERLGLEPQRPAVVTPA